MFWVLFCTALHALISNVYHVVTLSLSYSRFSLDNDQAQH